MRYASLARSLAAIFVFTLFIPSNLFVYADDDGTGTVIEDILLPEPRISHFPGENIELGSLVLTYDFEDVRIPGPNGLDIVVGRKYKHFGLADTYLELAGFGSKFDFKIPFISVGQSALGYDSTQSGFSCVMTAQTFGMNFYMPDQSMTTVGFSSSSLLPAGTLLAFTNNSVFLCENGLPVVRTSNGLKYVYGKKIDTTESNLESAVYYVTSIEDRFGNTITYNYDADIPSPYTGRLAAKLGSVSRNDGASVSFVYEQYENLFIVKEMNYGDRQITFDYVKPGFGPYTIDIVTDEEGRETDFDYYDVSAWLKTLTIPTGAKAEYNYQTTNPDQGLNGQVKWKKISGPDMETRNFTYLYRPDSSLHLYHADVFQSETDAINGQLIETIYTVKNRPTGTPFLPNEQALHTVTNGTVKQITMFYGGTPQLGDGDLVYSLVNSWVPVRHGDHGCQIHTQKNNQYKTCARPLLDKQVRTIYNGIDNITNVFTFDPYSFDQYGNPRKTRSFASYDGGDGSSRYVRQVYNNDVTNWLIGRTDSVSVSESDGNWTETYKRTYYAPTGVYKSLPHYDYSYGRWTKEFDEYHATGELKKVLFNGTDRVEIYENYKRGVPQERQLPDMSVSLFSFTDEMVSSFSYVDDYGNVVKAVDFRGNTTDYAYDALDRLTGVDYGGSNWNDEVIQYFDNDGYEKKTVGNLREYRYYDGLGRTILERATDVSQPSDSRITTKTEYDKQGNVSFSSFPVNATPGEGIHYKYDALGRKIEENIPDTNTTRMWEYLSGHSVRVTDGLGNETLIAYEAHARPQYDKPVHIKQTVAEEGDEEDPPFPIDPPCEVACRSTTPAEYIETFIDYDVFDNRTSVTQAGKTTSYVYDNYKQLCKISRADVGDTAMEYSASGNMMWSLKGATGPSTACGSTSDVNKISYLYNQRGELHMKTGSSPYFLELYGSDQNGNIAGTIASTSGAKYYIYNDRNQPLTEYNQLTGSILRWNYNANGDVSSMVYPDGTVVDYQPDALGRPTQAGQFASNVKYHKTGALSEYTFGNGIKRVITRRDSSLVQSITDSIGSSTRFEHSYVFDEEQNLTSLIDSVQPGYNLTEFEYDGASRLTQVRGVWGLGEFEYDSMNNIDRMTLGSRVANYNYNSKGQLGNVTGDVSKSFSYDTSGNVTGNGQRTFIYDQASQMITSGGIDFSYDAFGKRTKKVHNGQYTYFDYARNGNLYRKTNPDDSTVDYVYLNGNVIAEKESDGQSTRVTYLHSDSLGSVSLQTDDNAAVTKRYHYEPFGKAIESGQSDSPGYAGHVYDDDLSLTYMKARYYDSDVGRFYSNDPVGFTAINPASYNRYVYGNNNPYKYTDPDGEYAVAAPVVLVGLGGYILYRTYKAAKNVSNEVSSRPILVYKDEETRTLDDLDPIHEPNHPDRDKSIDDLSDEELAESLKNPKNGDKVTVKGGRVYDGNTRVNEAKGRGFDGSMEIPVDVLPEDEVDPDDPLGGLGQNERTKSEPIAIRVDKITRNVDRKRY